MNIIELLEKEEGFREKAYYCSEGYPTIGIGWLIGYKDQPLEDFKAMTICKEAARAQLANEVGIIERALFREIPCYKLLNRARQMALISMAYQMGITGLLKFKKMLAALEAEDYTEAAIEAADSKWYKQTTNRAARHVDALAVGYWA